jgi:RNA polymerase sigma-70 factor (ECF subfamily)
MDNSVEIAKLFDAQRSHLRAVAYRMLGSVNEADDAVQEAWLRLNRSDAEAIHNLEGWLTTVVARVCLDVLRSRKSRREESLEEQTTDPVPSSVASNNPEEDALLADSVGLALLVVLDTLTPAERVAFVLHDVLDLSFDEIAPIVGRTPVATRQLASRARKRVRGGDTIPSTTLESQRVVVNSFLTALRAGDFEGLIAVLDPDVVVQTDIAGATGAPREVRGARNWAKGAVAFSRMAQAVQPALINGVVGLILAPGGRLARALSFTIERGKITRVEVIGDPNRLNQLEVRVVE